jgi:hypothetical protein
VLNLQPPNNVAQFGGEHMEARDLINTATLAAMLGVKEQTLRSAICRRGDYYGLRPLKLPNRLLRWSRAEAERLLRGERVEQVS